MENLQNINFSKKRLDFIGNLNYARHSSTSQPTLSSGDYNPMKPTNYSQHSCKRRVGAPQSRHPIFIINCKCNLTDSLI